MTKARAVTPSPSLTFYLQSLTQRRSSLLLAGIVCLFVYRWVILQPIDIEHDNIGNVPEEGYLSYGPIDAVYTWVNGSDPIWKAEKDFWRRQWMTAVNGQSATEKLEVTKDTPGSNNRFRDNDELRFSLRSLEKYAPWIRHIYIVTDGQIPSWLNLDSPRISIVPHRDIFLNKSHLPVFASPAIESNLVNIPGLSEQFLYLNDDVFLGSHVTPSDFISVDGVQKIYLAWGIPPCSTQCENEQLGNGMCDLGCNTTSCDYDHGDCGCTIDTDTETLHCDQMKVKDNLRAKLLKEREATLIASDSCRNSCTYDSLGDGQCSKYCDTPECGFDGGDCNTSHLLANLSMATYPFEIIMDNEKETSKLFWIAEVSVKVPALTFNLSSVIGPGGSIHAAEHDNTNLIRQAVVHEDHLLLVVIFGREDDSNDGRTGGCNLEIRGRTVDGEERIIKVLIIRGRSAVNAIAIKQPEEVESIPPTNETVAISGLYTFLNESLTSECITSSFNVHFGKVHVSSSRGRKSPALEEIDSCEPNNVADSYEAVVKLFLPLVHTDSDRKLDRDIQLQFEVALRDRGFEYSPTQSEGLLDYSKTVTCMLYSSSEFAATSENFVDIKAELPEHHSMDEAISVNIDSPQCINMHDNGILLEARVALPPLYDSKSHGKDSSDPNDIAKVEPRLIDGRFCFADVTRQREKYCYSVAFAYYNRQNAGMTATVARDDLPGKDDGITDDNKPYYFDKDAHTSNQARAPVHDEDTVGKPRDESPPPKEEKLDRKKEETRIACALKKSRVERLRLEKEWEVMKGQRHVSVVQNAGMGAEAVNWVRKLFSGSLLFEKAAETYLEDEYAHDCGTMLNEVKDLTIAPSLQSFSSQEKEAAKAFTETFGSSLRFVDKLYNRAFGKAPETRRCHSHMPYLIRKSTFLEMKSHWPQEFKATSSHRFRHPHDMQFGFSYAHYVMNRHKLHPPTIEEIWAEYFDVNRNGILDHLEMLTVASMADGVTTSETSIQKLKDCLQPPNAVKTIEKDTRDGKLEVCETLQPFITLDSLKKCKNVTEKLIANIRRKKTYELMSEAEITFHMLSDNPAYALGQMLNTRARRTKFLCINDDMKNPSLKLHQLLHELFLAFWPNRSQFELPRHLQNRYLHIDEYYLAQQQVQKIYLGLLLVVVVLVTFYYWRDSIRIVAKKKVTRARTCSSSVLKRERIKADKNVIHKSSTSALSPRASSKSDADFVAKKME